MTSNFSGAWNADLAKSRFLSPVPKAITAQIDHAENHLRAAITSVKPDGAENTVVFTCRTTGEDGHTTLDGKTIRGRANWDNDELIIECWLQLGDRELYLRDCWSLIENGQILIMEHRDDSLSGQRSVLERQ
jgi:hypothetical protein